MVAFHMFCAETREHAAAIHILRMVILLVGTITDYLVLKLH